jgi:O-antigen ligase
VRIEVRTLTMSTLTGAIDPGRRGLAGAALAGALAIALGLATAIEPRTGILLAMLLLMPVLVWAPTVVPLGLLALALGLNVDLVTAPVHVALPQFAGLALIGNVLLRVTPRNQRAGLWHEAGAVFAIATLPSLVSPLVPSAAVSGFAQLVLVALMLWAATRALLARTSNDDLLARLLVAGALISLVPAFTQVAFGIGPVEYTIGGVMRAYSTYRQPNSYGAYLAGALPIALALGLSGHRRHYLIAAAAIAAGLVLTGSRGAWIGALAGLLVFVVLAFRPRTSTVLALVGALLLMALAALIVPRSFIAGRLDLTDWSSQQRLLVLLTAIDGILRNPVLGYGPGSFENLLPAIARSGLVDDVRIPHNLFLHVWFELGLAALLVLVAVIGGYYRASIRALRRSRSVLLAGSIGAVSAMLGASMFGTLFIRGVQEEFVLLVAMTAAAVHDRPS